MPPKRKRGQEEAKEEEEEQQQQEAEEETVASVAAPAHVTVKSGWNEHGTLLFLNHPDAKPSSKIAAFDMDHTLIDPKSGAKFPKGRSDWKWFLSEVPSKLKQIHNDGFQVVIITNQGGIEKKNQKASDITGKIDDLSKALGIPIQALIATATDFNRKPNTTMFKFLIDNLNSGVAPDMKESFYCGDAAGRAKNWAPGKPKDFNVSVRAFAYNCKLNFFTPEEYFLGSPSVPFSWMDSIDPDQELKKCLAKLPDDIENKLQPKGKQEVVMMVGPPACGKSTLSKRYFVPHGYVHVNRDTLGTRCKKVAEISLGEGKSIVVDNTNPSAAARSEYTSLAKANNCTIRCFVLATDIELAHHLNFYREKTQGVRRIPDVGYNMYKSKFEKPSLSEGFEEIIEVPFVPKFDSDGEKKLFYERTC